jgi:hypothetical protein
VAKFADFQKYDRFLVLQVCYLHQTFKPTAESCIFVGKLVSILVVDSRICLFHRLRFVSVFCIIFVTLDSFLGDRYFVVTCSKFADSQKYDRFFVLQVCHLRQTFKPTAESCIFVHIILQECKM